MIYGITVVPFLAGFAKAFDFLVSNYKGRLKLNFPFLRKISVTDTVNLIFVLKFSMFKSQHVDARSENCSKLYSKSTKVIKEVLAFPHMVLGPRSS